MGVVPFKTTPSKKYESQGSFGVDRVDSLFFPVLSGEPVYLKKKYVKDLTHGE